MSIAGRVQLGFQCGEQGRKLSIPLCPIMVAAGNIVKFEAKAALLQKLSKFAVNGEQAFSITAGHKHERRGRGIGGYN